MGVTAHGELHYRGVVVVRVSRWEPWSAEI